MNIPSDLPIAIRPAEPQDYPFILTSWSNDVHHLKYDSFIPNSIFFPRQKNFINNVLKQSSVYIAHLDDDLNLICGYLVFQEKPEIKTFLLHWAHTKPIYRKQQIFSVLLASAQNQKLLVATSPFSLLPQFKKKYSMIYDPSHVDSCRFL